MSKMSAAQLVAALVLVSVLAAALFIQARAIPVPALREALSLVSQQSAPGSNVGSNSVYISEQQLQRYIDHIASEHRWGPEGLRWLQIWNGRHEARCCGFPR